MGVGKRDSKIQEARFLILIPLGITAICLGLDCFYSEFGSWLLVLRCMYTYFFPSIAGVMVTVIVQKVAFDPEAYGIADGRMCLAITSLIVYWVLYHSCLSRYGKAAALVLGAATILYLIVVLAFCLDKKIIRPSTPREKEDEAYKDYVCNGDA